MPVEIIGVVAGALVWVLILFFGSTFVTGGSMLAGLTFLVFGTLLLFFWGGMPRFLRTMLSTVTFFAFLAFIGFIPKEFIRESSRLRVNTFQGAANLMAKRSKSSEREAGIFVRTSASGVAYSSPDGTVFTIAGQRIIVPANQKVRVMTLNGEPVTANGPEGMTQVMLQDTNRDYISGNKVWIPSRRLGLRQTAFLGLGKNNEAEEDGQWDEEKVVEVEMNDPRGTFIPLPEGHFRVWVEKDNLRTQYTDHRDGGRYYQIDPYGFFPQLGREVRNNRMTPHNPLRGEPSWAAIIKNSRSGSWIAFRRVGPIELDVKEGVIINLNCPQVVVPDEPIDPALNWVRNQGTVRIHFQRQL